MMLISLSKYFCKYMYSIYVVHNVILIRASNTLHKHVDLYCTLSLKLINIYSQECVKGNTYNGD